MSRSYSFSRIVRVIAVLALAVMPMAAGAIIRPQISWDGDAGSGESGFSFDRSLVVSVAGLPVGEYELSAEERDALVRAWIELLPKLESSKDLAKFLEAHPLKIEFDRVKGSIAHYHDESITVDPYVLAVWLNGLHGKGYRDEKSVQALAWYTLTMFAHEVQHGVTHRQLEDELHFRYDILDHDDELISVVREVRMYVEMKRRYPDVLQTGLASRVDDRMELFLNAYQKGVEGIEELMKDVPSVRLSDPQDLIESWRENLGNFDLDIKDAEFSLSKTSPDSRPSAEAYLAERRQSRAICAQILDVLSNDSSRTALQRFFEKRVAELKARSAAD